MTIASHCMDLLRANGPMTVAELAQACRVARVTAARNPVLSVQSSIGWNADGRVHRVGDTYHLVSDLLEGRWLALERPTYPRHFDAGLDLHCLWGLARRDGVPLATGGELRAERYGGRWAGPEGWAPPGDVIALRLVAGTAEVSAVELDDAARDRGHRLAERLDEMSRPAYSAAPRDGRIVRSLLTLLLEDGDVLREPTPPLSALFPDAATPQRSSSRHEPYQPYEAFGAPPLTVSLPLTVYADLADAAADAGAPLAAWVADQLCRLTAWPRRRSDEHVARMGDAEGWHHDRRPGDYDAPDVVPLDRFR